MVRIMCFDSGDLRTTAGAAAVLFGSGGDESSEEMSLVREQINKVTSFVDFQCCTVAIRDVRMHFERIILE